MKYMSISVAILFLVSCMLFLASCSSEPPQQVVLQDKPLEDLVEDPAPEEQELITEPGIPDADILISGAKLIPKDIVIENNKETVITFYNDDESRYNLDIPIYGNTINQDILPKTLIEVTLSPRHTGHVAIRLNYAHAGTIKVE